jgi:hypothetical protein
VPPDSFHRDRLRSPTERVDGRGQAPGEPPERRGRRRRQPLPRRRGSVSTARRSSPSAAAGRDDRRPEAALTGPLKTPSAPARGCFFRAGMGVGWTSYCPASSSAVRPPLRATRASNAAAWTFRPGTRRRCHSPVSHPRPRLVRTEGSRYGRGEGGLALPVRRPGRSSSPRGPLPAVAAAGRPPLPARRRRVRPHFRDKTRARRPPPERPDVGGRGEGEDRVVVGDQLAAGGLYVVVRRRWPRRGGSAGWTFFPQSREGPPARPP